MAKFSVLMPGRHLDVTCDGMVHTQNNSTHFFNGEWDHEGYNDNAKVVATLRHGVLVVIDWEAVHEVV